MAQKYCMRRKSHLSAENKDESKYYAVALSSGIIDTKKVGAIISDRCSATETDVVMILNALSAVIKDKLSDGYKVKLDDLGIFSLSITSEPFDNPEACTPSKVVAKRICFTANKDLKNLLTKVEFEPKR
jgi:predicted histone-like DNA-binding protein